MCASLASGVITGNMARLQPRARSRSLAARLEVLYDNVSLGHPPARAIVCAHGADSRAWHDEVPAMAGVLEVEPWIVGRGSH